MILGLTVLLALVFLGALALPFLNSQLTEPLPPNEDPVAQDLAEERDALLRALTELESRRDLDEARRTQLRARYEAKTAQVLKRLDEHRLSRSSKPPQRPRPRHLSAGLGLLLVLIVPSIALIGNYVLPRVSQNGTVTTNRASDIALGKEVRRLERAVLRDPSADNLLTLADTYWQLTNRSMIAIDQNPDQPGVTTQPRYLEETRKTYRRIVEEISPVPGVAYRRLGFLALLENDLTGALSFLQQAVDADPSDSEAYYTLGEIYYFLGDMRAAVTTFDAFFTTSNAAEDETARTLLENARTLAPLVERVEAERSAENLLALADGYWEVEERNPAANLYAEVVVELKVEAPRAVRRIGISLFLDGNTEQAVVVLERARELEPDDLQTLLFLGNAYFTLDENERALEAWRRYVAVAGGSEKSGRVPELIAQAESRLAGEEVKPLTLTPLSDTSVGTSIGEAEKPAAEDLFSASCATCHGVNAQGGAGPRLAGNRRMANTALVRDTIRFGRGAMPGFNTLMSEDEIEQLVTYVSTLAEP